MTCLSPLPPNMNLIHEVYNSLGSNSLTSLSEISGILADSGHITSYHPRSREGLSAILCLPSTGLKYKVQKSVFALWLDIDL